MPTGTRYTVISPSPRFLFDPRSWDSSIVPNHAPVIECLHPAHTQTAGQVSPRKAAGLRAHGVAGIDSGALLPAGVKSCPDAARGCSSSSCNSRNTNSGCRQARRIQPLRAGGPPSAPAERPSSPGAGHRQQPCPPRQASTHTTPFTSVTDQQRALALSKCTVLLFRSDTLNAPVGAV
jgi:hypothetical protein